MSETNRTGLLKSSLGVAFATFLSRLLGLVRVMLEARVLGAGTVASAWHLAFAVPNLFRRLLGEGALGTALIPIVSHSEEEGGAGRVRAELSVVFAALSALLALIVALVAGGAGMLRMLVENSSIVDVFPVLGSERIRLALLLLPVLMPYAFFICLVGVIGAVLNTRRIFVLPALGALLLNFFLIGGLVSLWRPAGEGVETSVLLNRLAFLVLLSGVIQLLLMLVLLWRCGRFPAISPTAFRDCSVLKRLWHLVLPGMIGGAALQISFLVDRTLAICLGPQAVPALTNVDRIIDIPIGIFALALGSVLMASMARSAARGDLTGLADDLVFSLRHVYFVCIPMAVMVMFFWESLCRILFLGGNFTESDLEATRLVAIFYGAGIPSFCVLKVVLPAFYSRKIVKPPLYSSLVSIAANIVLNFCLMWHLRQGGIALATVLASMLNNTILLLLLKREGFRLEGRTMVLTAGRCLMVAVVTGAVLYFLYPVLRAQLTLRWFGELPAFLLMLLLFGVGYLGGNLLLRAAEPLELLGVLRRRPRA